MKKSELSKVSKKYRVFYKSESIFREWLDQNISRFNYKPIPNGKGGFYFKGITKNISLYIAFQYPEAMLSFCNIETKENYDYYSIQYIGDEKHNPSKGFYDADRTDEIYTYYNTYSELIITEVFELIIEYCNNNFKEDSSLFLLNYHGSTEAFIASSNEGNISKLIKFKLKNNTNYQYFKYKLFTQT